MNYQQRVERRLNDIRDWFPDLPVELIEAAKKCIEAQERENPTGHPYRRTWEMVILASDMTDAAKKFWLEDDDDEP